MIICKDEDPIKIENLLYYQRESVLQELKAFYGVSTDRELAIALSLSK